MTPRQFKPYSTAEKLRQEREDQKMWMMGMYVLDAVYVGAGKAVWGKKFKDQYMEKPLLQQTAEQNEIREGMTDEEKKAATERLFNNLKIMQTNFNMSKKKARE